jgi:hypothetical protein
MLHAALRSPDSPAGSRHPRCDTARNKHVSQSDAQDDGAYAGLRPFGPISSTLKSSDDAGQASVDFERLDSCHADPGLLGEHLLAR